MDNKGKTNKLTIKTPEGIVFSFQLAGPVTRFMGWAVDAAAIAVAGMIFNSLMSILGIISRDLALAAGILVYFLISIGYGIAAEWYWQGQTIGKRLVRLRVIDAKGMRLHFSQVVIRNLLRFADRLPLFYMVGGLACLISRHNQRLGDIAANTIVIWSPRISAPDLDQLLEGKYNSLCAYPHLAARLRQRVTPPEASIALQAVLRRDEFDAAPRITLFKDIAAYLKKIVPFPQEATDGVSHEQYVRNVVDILYRPQSSVRP